MPPRKVAGYGISIDRETGKTVDEHDSMQCCHCGHHFRVVPGSGKTRGFCMLCDGVTCGAPDCFEHFPFEKKLDLYEKGKLLVLR